MTSVRFLHLCDSLFPIGAFGYSDGLESATSDGRIGTALELAPWLGVCIDETIKRCDGPAIRLVWSSLDDGDWASVIDVDVELTALRPSSTMRSANRSMGLRLMRTWQAIYPNQRVERVLALAQGDSERPIGPTLPVAFAVAASTIPTSGDRGPDVAGAVAGYAYTRLAATISAAMRLMAFGQIEAHRLLGQVLAQVPAAVAAVTGGRAPIESFTPGLDLAQMTQQHVHSRLFRS